MTEGKESIGMAEAPKRVSFFEFVALMAFVMCFIALSIDLMLPALGQIGSDLGVEHSNENQLIITTVFLGVAVGQLIYGPLSDAKGRKPVMYLGLLVFIVGTLICLFAQDMQTMLFGRFLEGLGAASPRVLTVAVVRDQYKGPQMARVMSLIMTVFILVPVIAPMLGQLVLMLAGWRAIFVVLLLLSLMILVWFGLRLEESLPKEKRVRQSVLVVAAGAKEVLTHKVAMAHVCSLGLVFGAFMGFLSTVQQIFQDIYGLGDQFPFYFAVLASGLGLSSFINSKLVMRFGSYLLVQSAQIFVALLSLAFWLACLGLGGSLPLWAAMAYFLLLLMGVGLLFGNMNSMSMEPFGHIAGLASSVVGAVSTLLAVVCGVLVGQAFDGTLLPLLAGFILLGTLSALCTQWARKEEARAALVVLES